MWLCEYTEFALCRYSNVLQIFFTIDVMLTLPRGCYYDDAMHVIEFDAFSFNFVLNQRKQNEMRLTNESTWMQ